MVTLTIGVPTYDDFDGLFFTLQALRAYQDLDDTEVLVVDNSKEGDKRRRFEIAPKDYLKAEAFAEEKGLQFLGVYHSHPNSPAIPSAYDRMAAQPYFSYIIISVFDGEFSHIRSWQLNDDMQFEVENINNKLFIHQIK